MISNSLFGKKQLDIQHRQLTIGLSDEDHVIVKVHACGICGTDINFVKDDPMPLGHEIAAEVIEIGKNVNNVKVGDRVIVEDCTMCGICVDCKSGNPQYCRNMYNMENQRHLAAYKALANKHLQI